MNQFEMSVDTCWNEYDADYFTNVPCAVMLVAKGSAGEKLYLMHPFRSPEKAIAPASGQPERQRQPTSKEKNIPILQSNSPLPTSENTVSGLQTEFNLTTAMLAELLCVKQSSCNQNFEMKIDNIRFAGYPKKLSSSAHTELFNVVFVLPANVDVHVVESFQKLSSKLAAAVSEMQNMNGYFDQQEAIMREQLDHWEEIHDSADRKPHPYDAVVKKSKLAAMLVKIYDDAYRTGVVQCFVDDFIEVGICVQPKALIHNHLAPRNQTDISKVVSNMRPYHGILLLEDIWPTPDGNPHVQELLSYCSPELSMNDLQYLSGIPLLKIFQIVEHLLLWARCLVIYPMASENVYTSATQPKNLVKLIQRFTRQFGSKVHLAAALAHFNPPEKLDTFVTKNKMLCEQHTPARLIVFLLRHQLIMQLHKFCYIIPPLTGTELPSPPATNREKDQLENIFREAREQAANLEPRQTNDHWAELEEDIREIVLNTTLDVFRKDDFGTARDRLTLFLKMIPFLHGRHHVEDIMYHMKRGRNQIEGVIETYSIILSTFLRPDHIAD